MRPTIRIARPKRANIHSVHMQRSPPSRGKTQKTHTHPIHLTSHTETSIVSVMLHFSPFPFWMILQCLVDGADEYLQLLDVASETIRALFNMPQTLVF